jgi:hypothetical protein
MFFPGVASATAEFARVLRPGGRVCSSLWARARAERVDDDRHGGDRGGGGAGSAGRGGPGMFRCAAPGYVSARYETAGSREVAGWDVGVELVTDPPRSTGR